MNDRLIRGGLAGVAGMLWLTPWNLFSYYILHFAKASWGDMMSQLVVGHPQRTVLDFIVGFVLMVVFNGILGVLFVRFVVPERDGNYVLRAIAYAYAAWLVLFAFGTTFRIPRLINVHPLTTISNWIAVTGWAIIMGWLTGRWDSIEAREK